MRTGWFGVLAFAFLAVPLLRAQFVWNSGDLAAVGIPANTIGITQTLTIGTTANHDFNAQTLTNSGTVDWTGGSLRTGNAGSITNNAIFNDSASNVFNNIYGGAASSFVNTAGGTYNKTAAGTTTFAGSVVFTNAGTVNLDAGTLVFTGTGSLSGTGSIDADAGTVVEFNSDFTVPDASRLLGLGQYRLTAGTLTLTGTVNAASFELSAGTLDGTHTFNAGAVWTSTLLNLPGTTTNAAGSTFTISGTGNHDYNTHALVNNGTMNWTGGSLRTGNAGSITNNAIFNDSASNVFNHVYGGAASSFVNAAGGTYNKTAAGTTTFAGSVVFTNAGTVNVDTGTLVFTGTGSLSGTGSIDADDGTVVQFNSDFTVPDASRLLGLGQYRLTASSLTLTGTVNVASFELSGGNLDGTHTFTNNVSWNGSLLNGAGTTTNAAGSVLTIGSTSDHDFNGRTIINNGTVAWTGGQLRTGNAGLFLSSGTFAVLSSSNFTTVYGGAASSFVNAAGGVFSKSVSGPTFFDSGVSFTNAGLLELGAGTISVAGGFVFQPTSELAFDLAGPTPDTDFGLLSVSTALVLDGTLQVFFSGGFEGLVTPAQTFTLVTTSSTLGGVFSNVSTGARLNTVDGFGSFQVNYGAASVFAVNSVVLSNFAAIPEPATWTLLLGGLATATLARIRRRGFRRLGQDPGCRPRSANRPGRSGWWMARR